jgi:hypothetical protein
MPSGIFGAQPGALVGTPIDLDGVKLTLLDGQLVITPIERYPNTDPYKEKGYYAKRRAYKRKKKHLAQAKKTP